MDKNIRNREFLGQGLAFPLQVDPRGGITLTTGTRDIEQAIQIILETVPGERVMRPEFGCRVHELVFAPHDATTEGLVIYYVAQALERWEPRIELQEVSVAANTSNSATMLIEIKYRVKDTHDERSIVHPFYIMGEE